MPKSITKYKIFLSSPSELIDERKQIKGLIDELNITYGDKNNIALELIQWETHSGPGIGSSSAQEVINNDINIDYDIFLGILWKNFGTPTSNYTSGTEEEFELAYDRYTRDPNSVQILFYFKTNAPDSLNLINPTELIKIINFKDKLRKEKNVLYWEYKNNIELLNYLRLHIPLRINTLIDNRNNNNDVIEKEESNKIEAINNDELGIFDYIEIYDLSFNNSKIALDRISNSTAWIGNELNNKSTEINSLLLSKQQINKSKLNEIFRESAFLLNNYAIKLEPDIPIFSENFESGLIALSRMICLYKEDLKNINEKELLELDIATDKLIHEIKFSILGINNFLMSIKDLPRVSKDINKAKFNVERKINELLNNMESSLNILIELKHNIIK